MVVQTYTSNSSPQYGDNVLRADSVVLVCSPSTVRIANGSGSDMRSRLYRPSAPTTTRACVCVVRGFANNKSKKNNNVLNQGKTNRKRNVPVTRSVDVPLLVFFAGGVTVMASRRNRQKKKRLNKKTSKIGRPPHLRCIWVALDVAQGSFLSNDRFPLGPCFASVLEVGLR